MIKATSYYDQDTGELYKTNLKHVDASFDEEKGYLFWNRKKYAKTFQELDYPDALTDAEIGKLSRLSKKLYANTNLISYRGNGGIRPCSVEMMADLLGLEFKQMQRFLKKMMRLGIMAKAEIRSENALETQYYMSPLYYFTSNRIPLNLYLLFRQQLDRVLPLWVQNKFADAAKEIGTEGS